MECKRCGHNWMPRGDKVPNQCPKCKRYDYNRELKVIPNPDFKDVPEIKPANELEDI